MAVGSSDFHSRSVPEYSDSVGAYAAPDPNSNNRVQDANTINSGWRGARRMQTSGPGFQKDTFS